MIITQSYNGLFTNNVRNRGGRGDIFFLQIRLLADKGGSGGLANADNGRQRGRGSMANDDIKDTNA